MKLNAKKVEQIRKKRGRYADGHGLYLQVVSPTNASWQLRYERSGRERWMGFPRPVKLTESGRAIAWCEDELIKWRESRKRARDKSAA